LGIHTPKTTMAKIKNMPAVNLFGVMKNKKGPMIEGPFRCIKFIQMQLSADHLPTHNLTRPLHPDHHP
jgi:hypothetical protein